MAILGIEPIDGGVADPRVYGEKPILIFDIDGVLNRVPVEERYIGPDCGEDQEKDWLLGGCEHRRDPLNWEIVRIPEDADLFEGIPSPEYRGEQIHRDWQVTLWVSKELSKELRTLEASGKADIIFMSMWQENTRYLNGLMGTHFPYLEVPRKLSQSETGAKHTALFSFLRKVYLNHGSIPPFTWADDVVTADTYRGTIQQIISSWLQANKINEPANLIFYTEPEEGLKRSDWHQILDFVDAWGPQSA